MSTHTWHDVELMTILAERPLKDRLKHDLLKFGLNFSISEGPAESFGSLEVSDWAVRDGAPAELQRVTRIGVGGSQCFCPPASDWHRVATPADGPQTISLHLYGPGFDLDVGRSFVAGEPRTYHRRPFGALAQVRRAFRARPA